MDLVNRLKGVFDSVVQLDAARIEIDGVVYPIIDNVIIMLPPHQWTPAVKARMADREVSNGSETASTETVPFAEQIQYTFGHEWESFNGEIPEYDAEFNQYFDLIDLSQLRDARVLDAGSGAGRWAIKIEPHVRELVCVDFSDAIFVTARQLAGSKKSVFIMADMMDMRFRPKSFDLVYTLGVLHCVPVDAIDAIRELARFSDALLIYLYYALDNRPAHYRLIFRAADVARRIVCQVRNRRFRDIFPWVVARAVYKPAVWSGNVLELFGLGRMVPLWSFYHGKSVKRIEQDVYDRFFTSIEQRFRREEIEQRLASDFDGLAFSDIEPFWHFVCLNAASSIAGAIRTADTEPLRRAA